MGAGVARIVYPSRRSGDRCHSPFRPLPWRVHRAASSFRAIEAYPLKVIALALSEKEDRGIVGQNTSPERIVRSCPSNFRIGSRCGGVDESRKAATPARIGIAQAGSLEACDDAPLDYRVLVRR